MKIVNKNLVLMARKPVADEFLVSAGAHLTYVLITSEPWEAKPRLKFNLRGSDARLDFIVLIAGKGNGQYNFCSEIVHAAERTTSRQMIKAAMYDSSSTDFEGNTMILKSAVLSDAHLSHRALLMSSKARSNAIPAMEIMEDNVKAGHASSTGRPDKESLFYLQSRGISKARANALLVEAFFMDSAGAIPAGKEKETMLKWLKNIIL